MLFSRGGCKSFFPFFLNDPADVLQILFTFVSKNVMGREMFLIQTCFTSSVSHVHVYYSKIGLTIPKAETYISKLKDMWTNV